LLDFGKLRRWWELTGKAPKEDRGSVGCFFAKHLLSGCSHRTISISTTYFQIQGFRFIWKLDRLARSLRDLIKAIDELAAVAHIDTTQPQGRLLYQIVGATAEFERDLIRCQSAPASRTQKQNARDWATRKLTNQTARGKKLVSRGDQYRGFIRDKRSIKK